MKIETRDIGDKVWLMVSRSMNSKPCDKCQRTEMLDKWYVCRAKIVDIGTETARKNKTIICYTLRETATNQTHLFRSNRQGMKWCPVIYNDKFAAQSECARRNKEARNERS